MALLHLPDLVRKVPRRKYVALAGVELAEVCEVVIELYYQEVRLVLDNILRITPSA